MESGPINEEMTQKAPLSEHQNEFYIAEGYNGLYKHRK